MNICEKLRLSLDLKEKRGVLEALREKANGFEVRYKELERAQEEADTEEAIEVVRQSLDNLEAEEREADLEGKIAATEAEIGELEERLAEAESEPAQGTAQTTEERKADTMNKLQVRELLKTGEYYERSEVKEFYEKLKNIRAVGGEGLTIPQVIINRIMDIMGDYTTLYPLVNKIRVTGTARILIDTDTTPATWIEQSGAIPEGEAGTITNVDFDGFKVGKLVFVDNYILQDSIINIDDYVTKKIARAIAMALDKAIVKGEGASGKQPEGILTKLSDSHKVSIKKDEKSLLVDTVAQIKLIDTGEDSVGEIVAVMKRSTYYNIFFEYSVQVNSDGNIVGKLPNLSNPDLVGLRVVFNNNLDDDTVLLGDFSQYTLVEREDITIDNSEHVKFSQDQTAFRGKGRFDGKPVKPDAFVLVTITGE
jgi:HK97 family phage major capsid protein